MFNIIEKIFDFNQTALSLYSKRQEILSSNIANVDTPRYQSVDFNFTDELNKILNRKNSKNMHVTLKKTSPNHFDIQQKKNFSIKMQPIMNDEIKSNSNTVNMDRERIEFLNNSLKYQSSISFIKNEIKNIICVLKG